MQKKTRTKQKKQVQIKIWVEPKRKEKWESFVEEKGFDSLSELIRLSVEEKIEGKGINTDLTEAYFHEINLIEKRIKERIEDLSKKQTENMIQSTKMGIRRDENIKNLILKLLKEKGSSNQYYIAKTLNLDPDDVYASLCFLLEEKKIQKNFDNHGHFEWRLTDAI